VKIKLELLFLLRNFSLDISNQMEYIYPLKYQRETTFN